MSCWQIIKIVDMPLGPAPSFRRSFPKLTTELWQPVGPVFSSEGEARERFKRFLSFNKGSNLTYILIEKHEVVKA